MRIGKQNAGRRKDKVTGECLPSPVDEHDDELPMVAAIFLTTATHIS
ncbi:hypothetical protein ABIA70_002284 [Arthrobacter sp. 754]